MKKKLKALDRILQRWRIRKATAELPSGVTVLDIGCFDTKLFDALGGKLNYGVGIDPLLEPMQTEKYKLVKGYFPEALPDKAQQFDAVTMLAVLEHIPLDVMDPFSKNVFNILKPGGKLILTVPSPMVDYILAVLKFFKLIDGMSLNEHHGFDVRTTPEIFQKKGFKLAKHKSFQLGLNNLFVFEKPKAV